MVRSELVFVWSNQNWSLYGPIRIYVFIHFEGLEILKEKGEVNFVVDVVNRRRNTSPVMNNLQAIFAAFTWIQDM